jgi:hypothetical protein
MKKIFILLFALIPLLSLGQKVTGKVEIDLSDYYKKSEVDSLLRIRVPVVRCPGGPTITSITNVSKTSLTATITGKGLDRMIMYIYDEDSTVQHYAREYQYNNPEDVVNYSLSPGKYRLYVKGISCTGYSSRPFAIKEPAGKPDCPRGPTLTEVHSVASTALTFQFDGIGVDSLNYTIKNTSGVVSAFGAVKPTSSNVLLTYGVVLPDGNYTLTVEGRSCKNKLPEYPVVTKNFTVKTESSGGGPNPPPIDDGKTRYQIIMGTTGGGFQPDAPHGIDPQWVDRIEAFKYDWGYGISGICLWVGWNGYEKTRGVYEEEGFKKVIKFCRDRGLTLSVAFMGKRNEGDEFTIKNTEGKVVGSERVIKDDEIITGSGGTKYIEGVPGYGAIYASYGNDRVNGLMAGAIQSIAKLMKTYEKSFYMAMAGGGAGELVNHTFQNNGMWETADFAPENLKRFDQWVTQRGLTTPGRPPIIQGPGIDWPHPDYNNPLGLEFGRFTTYGIYKYYKSFVDAVKSVSNIPCLYFYSVTSNRQFRAIQNPNLNFIAGVGDGFYGSDGDGLDDLRAKVKVNSLNLGTLPNGISSTEVDPDDISPARHTLGRMPGYCEGNLNYDAFLNLSRDLFSRGLQVLHFAMSFCPQEIKGLEPSLRILHQEYIGKPYVRPAINASNTVTVEVTEKYRRSEDLMEGIDPYSKYTKYTDCNFWGPVKPQGATNCGTSSAPIDQSKLTGYLDNNLPAYKGNVLVDLKTPSGTAYSYTRGQYSRDDQLDAMSHSKLTTGAVIAQLISEGKISLDTRVGDIIRSWDRPGLSGITLRQIMGHTSGIPDDQTNEGAKTLEEYVDWLAGRPGFKIPGTEYSYSTVSYQVAARMAELVTRQSWKDIFNSRVRDKCDMGNAEYNPRGPGPVYGNPDNPLAGYGLKCSANQWANFAAMIRDGGMFKGNQVLSSQAISILKTKMTNLSNWGFGVILNGAEMISEAASGWRTHILPGIYSLTLITKSSYEATKSINDELGSMVRASFGM